MVYIMYINMITVILRNNKSTVFNDKNRKYYIYLYHGLSINFACRPHHGYSSYCLVVSL